MKKIFIGSLSVVAAVFLIYAGIDAFLKMADANQYRSQIAAILSQKTGRIVSLNGPITFSASWKGAECSAMNVLVSNPAWASRPIMASIGRIEFSVPLVPFLKNKLAISDIQVVDADIMLEAEGGGRNNWGFTPAAAPSETSETPQNPDKIRVGVNADKFSILDSRVIFYDRDGNARFLKVANMSVESGPKAQLKLEAEYEGVPLGFVIKTGANQLMPPRGSWPFSAGLNYANYEITAIGEADLDTEKASISSYEVKAGNSRLSGDAEINWIDRKPFFQGTLTGSKISLADLNGDTDAKNGKTQNSTHPAPRPTRLFDDAPLPLSPLRLVDALFDVKIDEIALTNSTLKQTAFNLNLNDGLLSVASFKTTLDGASVEGQMMLSASTSPPQFSVLFSASDIELEDVFRMITSRAFMSGKAKLDVNVASAGNSTHALASNAVGVVNLVAGHGNMLGGGLSSLLMGLFAPSGSNDLNCLAARFIMKDGIARDNGILLDTGAATISGRGNVNFGQETVDLILHTKTKRMNVGDLFPAAYVGGTLLAPYFAVDPSEVMKNVKIFLANGGSMDDSVPKIMTESGENSCVYTLKNPTPDMATSNGVLAPSLEGKAVDTINNFGGLIKGFFGQ